MRYETMSVPLLQDLLSVSTQTASDTHNENSSSENREVEWDYAFISSLVFYCLLLPIGIIGNLLSTIVVAYLIKYKKTRRITADILLGLLAAVDLLCIFAVHSISIVAFGLQEWPFVYEVCAYQGFVSAIYLHLEFFLQVGISIDRYVALTRPLQYQQMSPSRLTRMAPLVLIILSIGTLSCMVGWSPKSASLLNTWYFCMFVPDPSDSAVDTVAVCILSAIFFLGFITFVYCNINLVRILWQYNTQKTKHVLQELSVAVQVMEKKTANSKQQSSQPTSPEVKEDKLFNVNQQKKLKSGSRQSVFTNPSPKPQAKADKDQEIMNDLMTDFANLKHRLSTQMQVAPFLTVSSSNIPGSRKSSISKIKDMGVKLNKKVFEGISTTSTNTIDLIGKLVADDESKPTVLSNSVGNLSAQESSLENIVIHIPSLPKPKQEISTEQDLVCTTYIPKIRRSRTFSDIHEVSYSQASSKRNSYSSLYRSSSVGKMMKYPSSETASFRSSDYRLHITPQISPNKSQDRDNKSNVDAKNIQGNTLNANTMTSPTASPADTPRYKSRKPPNFVLVNGHANGSMPVKTKTRPKSASKSSKGSRSSEDQMSHFQRQMRKLLKRVERKAEKQRKEILLARLVLLCAVVFLVTWLPFVVMNVMLWTNLHVHDIVFDIGIKLVFTNIILNPVFYGLCRSNYRKGYGYVIHLVLHFLSCGCIKRPGDEKVFFDSKRKKRKRHQVAAEINMNQRMNKMRKRRISTHALQVLHTLHFQKLASPSGDKPRSPKSPLRFQPSARLQDLFDKYEAETDSDSDSSSIDYDALALDFNQGPDQFYKSLKRMWSMYVLNGDNNGDCINGEDEEEEFDLDVDYDAMLEPDILCDNTPANKVYLDCETNTEMDQIRRHSEGAWEADRQNNSSVIRFAVSTGNLDMQTANGISFKNEELQSTKL